MKTTKILAILVLALGLTMCWAGVSQAGPMGTAFTYQGRLIDAGSAADGLYDFQFKLFDDSNDPCSGNQLGSDVNQPDVDVIEGYFTVELDFGGEPNAFNGDARWLDIGVRPGDSNGVFTTLSPRQELTPTPYALHTRWFLVDTVLDNVFAGEGAGASNTTGNYNSAVGYQALWSNTKGYRNSAMGYRALDKNTTGNYNSAVGYQALSSNITGYANSAVGHDALRNNTHGYENSAMGYQALSSNTTGIDNSAMGTFALLCNTIGCYNSAMGLAALNSNTTGIDNSAVGKGALYFNTTGERNSAMGTGALHDNVDGFGNSAMGYRALFFNTTGNSNSAMGREALWSNTTGRWNSAMGYHAGFSNSTGSGNVFLGYRAGYSETGDNKLYIANDAADSNVLIYGDFNSGQVGIGTTSPGNTLEVGDGYGTRFIAVNGQQGGWSGYKVMAGGTQKWFIGLPGIDQLYVRNASDSNIMVLQQSGNVGIGTTTPANKLDVEGGMAVGATYSGMNTAPTNGMIIEGKVGIGTTSPAEKLTVAGNVKVTGKIEADQGVEMPLTYYEVMATTATEETVTTAVHNFCALTKVSLQTGDPGTFKYAEVVPNPNGTWTLKARGGGGDQDTVFAGCQCF